MAIYHLSVKNISRESGRSSVGASAYRSGEKLKNEHDGVTHDYTNRNAVAAAAYRSGNRLTQEQGQTHDFTVKKGVVYSEIMLPEHAPKEFADRSTLWNSVEKIEKQSNARTAREVEIALPNELNREQQIQLVQDYVRENFVDRGMCADFSIHAGHKHTTENEFKDELIKDNPHVHIMLTTRPMNKDGAWGQKSAKEYILDRYGNRIKLPSGEWKSRKIPSTDWDKTQSVISWRKNWADMCNEHLKEHGYDEKIDHRTLKAQGIDREPTKHEGVSVRNMERRGIETERGRINKEIIRRNQEKAEIERQIKELERQRREELKKIAGKSSVWEHLREVEQQAREQIQREREELRANRKPLDIAEIARKAQQRQIAELGERPPSEREELKRIAGKSRPFDRLFERAQQSRDQVQNQHEGKQANHEPVDIAEIAKKAQARQILEFSEREKQRVKEQEYER